uniref:Transcription factor PIF3 n=1 Tax=Anthurium amnicola TaxID=1678845 RepID=A0A1D1XPH0_9ARAE
MMSLPDFHSVLKGKRDSGQPKTTNCSLAPSPLMPEHEFVELLWENGHVVMQGQSNRNKKGSFPNDFPSLSGKAKEEEAGVAVAPKASRQRAANMVGNDLQTTGPPGQMGLNGQDDELVPWLNCPIDDYCSEFLYEFSGVNLNSPSSVVPTERIGSFGQAARDTHGVGNGYGSGAPAGSPEPCRMGNSHLLQPSQRCQDFSPSGRLKEVDPTMCGAHQGTSGGELPPATMQRPDPTTSNLLLPNRSTPLMNFSHFSRPVAMAKANLLGVDRVRGSEKASNVAGGNLMKSTAIESASCLKSASAFHGPLTSVKAKADSNPPVQPSQLMAFVEHSGPICQEDAVKDSGHRNRTDASSNRKFPNHMKYQGPDLYGIEKHETAWKHREPVIASSSVCSANDDGAASDDVKNKAKWKCQEGDASENPSESLVFSMISKMTQQA